MQEPITEIRSFGDVRQLILQTIIQMRDGALDTQQGMVMAAHFKCLNDNINSEVNAAKIKMQAIDRGFDFGKVMKMGQGFIGNDNSQKLLE